MRTISTLAATALAAALVLAGCASLPPGLTSPQQYSPTTYAPGQMQQAQQVETGTILAITQTQAQGQPLRVGERVEIVAGNGWGGGAARVLPLR